MMKAYIESMGCDSNRADTNRVQKYLKGNGVDVVEDYKIADYIILMSCGFNSIIMKENLKRLYNFKKTDAKIILGGCIPKLEKIKVDYAFGPKELYKLDEIFKLPNKIANFSPEFNRKHKKIVRVSTGCSGKCSYCAIKLANGKTKSRSIEDIKKDIQNGLNEGFSRFIFASEDIGSWGIDVDSSIIDLLKKIIQIPGNFSIQLTTVHPKWFLKYPELFDVFSSEKIEKKVYLPLQSGSDRILKLMKRGYTVKEFLYIFNKLKNIKIQTDVLVGFPTETEEEFKQTFDLIKELDIYFLQVFAYTDMENTISSKIYPKVPYSIAETRAKACIKGFLKKGRKVNTNIKTKTNIIS
jgi:threonylcarbamoyladenosine tRNA methylthiotransferase CDKAL1